MWVRSARRGKVNVAGAVALVAAITTGLAGTPSLAAEPAGPATADLSAALDAIAGRLPPGSPGCQIGATKDGVTVIDRVFGIANLEQQDAITDDTVFDAASVAKQFTATAILLLAADGKLSLTDDIRKTLPEMRDYGTPITIEHLLTHTSGIRNYSTAQVLYEPSATGGYSNPDILYWAARQSGLEFTPGAAYSYSNTNYILAAMIVARVSGQSFADFTKDRIFTPLGMSHTQWRDDFARVVPHRAAAYLKGGGGYRSATSRDNLHGAGGLLTTSRDLLLWLEALNRAHFGPQVAAEQVRTGRLANGYRLDYAKGLQVGARNGETEIFHSGGTGGFRSWTARYPGQKLAVVLLCNAGDEVFVDDTGRALADLLMARPAGAAAASDAPGVLPTTAMIDRLAGIYVDTATGMPTELTRDGDRLRMDGATLYVRPDGLLVRPEWGEVRVAGDTLTTRELNGRQSTLVRAAPVAPDAQALAALTGHYFSDDLAAGYDVTVIGQRLLVQRSERPAFARYFSPLGADLFGGSGIYLRFTRDSDRRVDGLEFLVSPYLRVGAAKR